MYTIRRFENWGVNGLAAPLSREATSLAAGVTQKLFNSISGWQRNHRQGISICFLSASATDVLYVRIVPRGAAAPTNLSTTCDYVLGANQTLPIHCGPGVDVWIQHSHGSNSLNYTASEFS